MNWPKAFIVHSAGETKGKGDGTRGHGQSAIDRQRAHLSKQNVPPPLREMPLAPKTSVRVDPLDELERDPDVRAAIADVEELRRKEAEIRRQSRFQRFRDTLLEWGHYSSYDGIASLVRADNNRVRLFWALFVLASLALFVYLIIITLRSYLLFDTNVQLDLNHRQFEFPAVTFCNASPYKLSKVHLSPGLKALVDLYNRLVKEGRIQAGKANLGK